MKQILSKLNTRVLKILIIVFAFTGLLFPPMSSFAHDNEGNTNYPGTEKPAISITVDLVSVGVSKFWEEKFNGDATLYLDCATMQSGHITSLSFDSKKIQFPIEEETLGLASIALFDDIDEKFIIQMFKKDILPFSLYKHVTCSPTDDLFFNFRLAAEGVLLSEKIGKAGKVFGYAGMIPGPQKPYVKGVAYALKGTSVTMSQFQDENSNIVGHGRAQFHISSEELVKIIDLPDHTLEKWFSVGGSWVKLKFIVHKTNDADCIEIYKPQDIKIDPVLYKDGKSNPLVIHPGDSLEYNVQITNTNANDQRLFLVADFKNKQVSIDKFIPFKTKIPGKTYGGFSPPEPERTLFGTCKVHKNTQTIKCEQEIIPSGTFDFTVKLHVNDDAETGEFKNFVASSGTKIEFNDSERNRSMTWDREARIKPVSILEKESKDLVIASSLYKDSQLVTKYVYLEDSLQYKVTLTNSDEKAKKVYFVTDFSNSQVKITGHTSGDNIKSCEKYTFNLKARLYCEGEIPVNESESLQVNLTIRDTAQINRPVLAETITSKDKVSQYTLSRGHSFLPETVSSLENSPLIKPIPVEKKIPKEVCNNKELSEIKGPITLESGDKCIYKLTSMNTFLAKTVVNYKVSAEPTGDTEHEPLFLMNPRSFEAKNKDGIHKVFENNKITASQDILPGTYKIKWTVGCEYNGFISHEIPMDGKCDSMHTPSDLFLDVIVPDPCVDNNNNLRGQSFQLPAGWSILFGEVFGDDSLQEDPCPEEEINAVSSSANSLRFYPGYDDLSYPLNYETSHVSYGTYDSDPDNLYTKFVLDGAKPNHDYRVGVTILFDSSSDCMEKIGQFDADCWTGNRQDHSGTNNGITLGIISTDNSGNGSLETEIIDMPPGTHDVYFYVVRDNCNNCSVVHQTTSEFTLGTIQITIPENDDSLLGLVNVISTSVQCNNAVSSAYAIWELEDEIEIQFLKTLQ